MPDVARNVRAPDDLWHAFTAACRTNATTASRVLRDRMTDYVKENGK